MKPSLYNRNHRSRFQYCRVETSRNFRGSAEGGGSNYIGIRRVPSSPNQRRREQLTGIISLVLHLVPKKPVILIFIDLFSVVSVLRHIPMGYGYNISYVLHYILCIHNLMPKIAYMTL